MGVSVTMEDDVSTTVELAKEAARQMAIEKVYSHYKKTQNPQVKKGVREVIGKRGICAECEGKLFYNEPDEEYYCPICEFSIEAVE